FRHWLLFLLLSMWSQAASGGGNAFEVRPHIPVADLVPVSDFIEDTTGQKTLEQVLALPEVAWNPGAANKLTFGWTSHAYWVRVVLKSDQRHIQSLILEIDWPLLDDIQLHILNSSGQLVEKLVAGDMYPFRERPIIHTSFAFPVDLPSGELREIYIRVASTSSTQIPIKLWQEKFF
ncbi:MAG: hypothetical protein M3Q07_19995, partial [Pseudobdellovibrionaceae bacterium]|nr:hypothetical protein [Pseudobdellovibrionaceae bacterium]